MAQKRMFSLKIIDTDLFLDMPVSSQLLYFHLSMRADDDGFVSSPQKIIKMVNCSSDDLKILTAKNFIIPFDSGVCVIRHWRIHNYIQNDRYQGTLYNHEKSNIELDNGTYNLMDTECIQNGYKVDTQIRLDKVSIDKIKLDKVITPEQLIINSYTTNEELKEVIQNFIKMRKSIKKTLTDNALELILKKLTKLTAKDNEKIEILNNSIMNSYQGIFAIKKEGANTNGNGYSKQNNEKGKGKWSDFKPKESAGTKLTESEIAELDLI